MRFYPFLLLGFILSACGSEERVPIAEFDEPVVKVENYIKISDEYSLIKNDTAPETPTYLISSLDSFVVDVSDYEFDKSSVFYRYLENQDEFLNMIGGSFGHINIYYNDSMEIITGYPIDIKESKIFAIVPQLHRVEGPLPQEFILTFGMFIDNGRGMVDFDAFKVKVVATEE